MTFDELLAQVRELRQREQRLSYREDLKMVTFSVNSPKDG